MLVGKLPDIVGAARIAGVDNRTSEIAKIGNVNVIRLVDGNVGIEDAVEGPDGNIRLGGGRMSVEEAEFTGHGDNGGKGIGPEVSAFREQVGQIVGAESAQGIAGEVEAVGIEGVRILSLEDGDQVLDLRSDGVVRPVAADGDLRRDKEAGKIRLVIGVGRGDQGQGAMRGIIGGRELNVVIRAAFSGSMEKEDDGVLDVRIEVLGQHVAEREAGTADKRGLPNRVHRRIAPKEVGKRGIGRADRLREQT